MGLPCSIVKGPRQPGPSMGVQPDPQVQVRGFPLPPATCPRVSHSLWLGTGPRCRSCVALHSFTGSFISQRACAPVHLRSGAVGVAVSKRHSRSPGSVIVGLRWKMSAMQCKIGNWGSPSPLCRTHLPCIPLGPHQLSTNMTDFSFAVDLESPYQQAKSFSTTPGLPFLDAIEGTRWAG